jgi:regulator of protease activity HflC (stomatin/prohibitin superfamily)
MFEDAMARIESCFKRPEPVRQSTPEQMAAAREAAKRVVTHDGLPPGQRLVNGRPYTFNLNMSGQAQAQAERDADPIKPTAETVAYINSQVCMDYNAKLKAQGAEAVRLAEKIAKARRKADEAATFSQHRLAEAMHHIAAERRDHFFQITTWGHDSGLTIRRQALGQYLATLRLQARRSRMEAKAAA